MIYIVALLLIHPSITFGLLKAEVFPYAIIFSLFFTRKLNIHVLILILVFLFFGGVSFFFTNNIPDDFLRSFFAYLNPLFGVLLIYSSSDLRNIFIKYGEKYFYFLLIFGIIQHFNFIPFLDSLIKILIPRGSMNSMEESGRGISLLATEPARGGLELLYLYMFVRCAKKSNSYFLDLILIIYIIFVLKSFIVFSSAITYFFFIYFKRKHIIRFSFVSILCLILIFKLESNSRAILLINSLWELPVEEKFKLINNTSGNRLTSILTFYNYGTYTVVGSGIGNWEKSSMLALKYNNIDPMELNFFKYDYNIGMRGSGYITNLILDIGILGVSFFLFFFLRFIFFVKYISRDESSFLILFLLSIFFIGSVGTTTHWVLFFVLYFNKFPKIVATNNIQLTNE